MRSLRLAVLCVALCALWALPEAAVAIITPDEPTPPKPTTAAPAGDQRPAVPSSTPPPAGGASAAMQADAAADVSAISAPVAKDTAGVRSAVAAYPTPAATAAAAASKPPQATAPAEAVEQALEKVPATTNEKDTAPLPSKPSTVEVVHERYVRGRGASGSAYFDDDDLMDDRDLFSTSSFEIEDSDAEAGGAPGSGKRQNYASLDAGATILDSSPELKSPTNLLVPDKDRYMLMPCEKPRKWVVVSLSEDVHADAIAVANFEKFSSTVKEFIVLGSVNYPTDTWFVLGNFTAAQQNGEQIFPLDSQHHVRYIKLRFFSHYGSEYYCTLSQLKVYGRTFTQVISQLEKSIDAEGGLDIAALPPSSTASTASDGDAQPSRGDQVQHARSPSSRQCLEESICAIFMGTTPIPPTCSIHDAPKQSPAKLPPFLQQPSRPDDQSEAELTSRELAALEALGRHVDHHQATTTSSPSTASPNASVSGTAASTRSNGSAAAAPPAAAAATTTTALHAQGLGRLESIFVRITKKIQQLELNQSVFARQLEETKALTASLHTKQDALATQMHDIRTILFDMRTRMDRESANHEQYRRLVDELRKDNIALWNEMLIVREVITTMKAAILCALALSACIILFYLLRLLLRCVQSAKRRADLREWFWHVESLTQQQHQNDEVAASSHSDKALDNDPVGSLRVNYKKQFGSSWDDLAIERKTLLRDLVDEEASSLQTVHGGHRNKRLRTASLVNPPKLQDLVVQMELAHLAAEASTACGEPDDVVKEEPEELDPTDPTGSEE